MVSAVVVAAARESEVDEWGARLLHSMNSRQMREVHFAKLPASRKLVACQHIASLPVRCFVVASNKQNMRGWRNPFAEKIPSDNWFYCWMTRLLLERVTHWVEARSKKEYGSTQKVKLVFSERGGLSYSQLNAYYQWLRYKGDNQKLTLGNLSYETIDMKLLEVRNHSGDEGLKMPDIVASAFFKAADVHDTRSCDPQFALALRDRMARSPTGQISGYGVKLMPGFTSLKTRVQPNQLAVFRHYGYPAQWWRNSRPQAVLSAAG